MATDRSEWKTYFLGVLLTIVCGLSTVAYTNITNDISELQTDKKAAVAAMQQATVQVAILTTEVAQLKGEVADMKTSMQGLTREVNDLNLVISTNTKTYRENVRIWTDALNRASKR